jgi:hypothetical protein
MKKEVIAAACISSLFALCLPVMADEAHPHGAATTETQGKAEKKTGRKKRQFICKDCGKPESKCDCPEELKAKERAEAAKKKAEGKEE